MKITCQACQAKYTIADDKVAGKVVKIRCKKCGASIVVNGNESQGRASSAPPGAGAVEEVKPTDKDAWTVNVADGDQRTMTEAEIVDNYRGGLINDDTFCWREGMGDWLSLQEIAPLHAACKKVRSAPPGDRVEQGLPSVIHDPTAAGAGAARLPPRPSDHPAAKDGNGAGALAGPPAAATVAARRMGGRAATADLFGGASRAGGDDEVMTSAPAGMPEPHADGQKATGARNENSVLFALEKGEAPPPQTMPATNEASGLIDIRQLSAQMHSSAEKRDRNARVDDIMNLGTSAGLNPTLGAPLLSAPSLEHYSQPPPSLLGSMGGAAEAKNKAVVFLALGAGTFFLVAAIGIAVLLVRSKGEISVEGEKTAASASASGKPVASEAPQASAAPEAPSASATETASAAAPAPTKEAKETAPKETPVAAAAPKEPKAAAAPAPPKEAAPPTGAPAAEFNMGEARSRLAAVAAGVQTCKRGDTSGSGRVEIVFAPSGAVQSANLMPGSPFDGTLTGKCVEARFRGARVPAFGGTPFTVTKSFSIN